MNAAPARHADAGSPRARRAPQRATTYDALPIAPADAAEGDDADGLDGQDAADGVDAAADGGDAASAASGLSPRALPADDTRLAVWIAQVADRDECALSALYDATLSRIYGLVLRIVRRPAWAEEVVEETYFQVWRQAPRFDPERGRALTWLLGMARSRAIDALRREARHDHDLLDDDAQPLEDPHGLPAADWVDAARGQAELHRALLRLGAQPRQLVALAFFRGLSHEEIAEQMALPLGTVKSQIRRALLTLRELLAGMALPPLPG